MNFRMTQAFDIVLNENKYWKYVFNRYWLLPYSNWSELKNEVNE